MGRTERVPADILQAYVPLVQFIADVFGPLCEVVLQDVRQPNHSIIAICNGHVSGRSLGGPLTNLALKILASSNETPEQSLINYDSKNSHGENMVSSTYFIRDDDDKLIGMLGINVLKPSYSNVNTEKETGEWLLEHSLLSKPPINEYLDASTEQIVMHSIEEILVHLGKDAGCLTTRDKKQIIALLQKNGVFKIHRAVTQVASVLGMADSTVYRYLSQSLNN
jgi:predicted transcriptional regulator YheO